ncbi:MAG TPA: inorganic diphosphatase [Chloroflexia bacterium]|nr:inorganic diphosphatase [Chloroflexia bacterium]
MPEPPTTPLAALAPWAAAEGQIHVVIETPKGNRNKYMFWPDKDMFMLSGVLPVGAVFPFDFGFIPGTLGADGDPLDVLLLLEEPAFAGCVVETRLLGVIEADQTEDGATTRNDRLIGVAAVSRDHRHIAALEDLNENLVSEIEHFFASYNTIKGKQFTVQGRGGPERARALVEEGIAKAKGK